MGLPVSSSPHSFEHRYRRTNTSGSMISLLTKYLRTEIVIMALLLYAGFRITRLAELSVTKLRHLAPSSQERTSSSTTNATSDGRDVVFGPPVSFRSCANADHIALTFDDGPSTLTPALLDILAKHDAKATFFFVGVNFHLDDTIHRATKRTFDEGHHVASHLWSHPDLLMLDEQSIREQLTNNSNAQFEITGRKPRYMRPPYGSVNDAVERTLFAEGYKSMMWSCDSSDWRLTDASDVTANIDRCNLDGLVLLLHEGRQSTLDAVDTFLRRVRAEHPHKKFVRADECSGFPGDAYVAR